MMIALLLSAMLLAAPQQPAAQPAPGQAQPPAARPGDEQAPARDKDRLSTEDEKPVVTHHEIKLAGRVLKYTVTAGMMPIRGAAGEVEARIFFMAYTLEGPAKPSARPLMFSFNGGPGSSSVWLHLGAIGPRRVRMEPEGWFPQPPFQLVDNESTWLDLTDIVFIDPVGTGYSRAAKPELGKKFWSRKGDIESVAEFIRLYLTRYDRWPSPLFLVGESYGTTRAAGLSGYLVEHGIALNGVILVSTILNFQTADFAEGNDVPYALYVPTYAATAWYHRRLPADLQKEDLRKVVAEAERWATTDYVVALQKGSGLAPQERDKTAEMLARYTGLDRRVIDNANLRIDLDTFNTQLLRDRNLVVGRLDSRFTGRNPGEADRQSGYDPSMSAIRPPFTAAFYDYARTELGYKTDADYYILGGGFTDWDMNAENRFADVSGALRSAFIKNPYMKVYVAMGYYDFATPYFAAAYTFDHLGLDAAARGAIETGTYEAGHMMYIRDVDRAKLRRDVGAFMQHALGK